MKSKKVWQKVSLISLLIKKFQFWNDERLVWQISTLYPFLQCKRKKTLKKNHSIVYNYKNHKSKNREGQAILELENLATESKVQKCLLEIQ